MAPRRKRHKLKASAAADVTPVPEWAPGAAQAVSEAVRRMEWAAKIPPPELLYGTTDPTETPLIIPGWARNVVPGLAELIDEGLKRRAEFPCTDAEREMMRS